MLEFFIEDLYLYDVACELHAQPKHLNISLLLIQPRYNLPRTVSYEHNLMPADGSDRDSRKSGLVSPMPVDGSDRDSRKSGLVSIMTTAVSLPQRHLVHVWSCKGGTVVCLLEQMCCYTATATCLWSCVGF